MAVAEKDEVKSKFSELSGKYKQLCDLRASLKKLEGECVSSVAALRKIIDPKLTSSERPDEELKLMSGKLREMNNTFPHPPMFFLKLIIGNINVTLLSDDKLAYRQDYEKYKLIITIVIMVLSLISMLFPSYILPSALAHCASVFYYFTVTLKELVLRSNGSRIKWWWLVHHYFSIVLAAIFLTWPPGECYNAFKVQLMLFTFCLSFVMTLQFRYQRMKLYKQVAMGNKHPMTVSQESSLGSVRDFTFLISCLFGVYVFQFYNAYLLFRMSLQPELECHWHAPVSGLLFLIVAALNSITLFSVLSAKLRPKQKQH